jgi:hypothetical protein
MIGKEYGDLLIQVTTWTGLTVSVSSSMHGHVRHFVSVLNAFSLEVYSNTLGKECTKVLKETSLIGRR